jgi:molybdenum cofactor cytidylyltransferase
VPPAAGLVLAAGQGARLGGRPKSLLQLDGVPLLQRAVAALTGAGVADVVVVTGFHADQIEPLLATLPVRTIRNPQPQDGPTSSLRAGLVALASPVSAIVVMLADQPLIEAADVAALLDAWRARPDGIDVLFPQVHGRRGNPVILSATVRADLLSASPSFSARDWQAAHPQRCRPWATDNRHYRVDIDTAEDLERFARETGHVLRWPPPA